MADDDAQYSGIESADEPFGVEGSAYVGNDAVERSSGGCSNKEGNHVCEICQRTFENIRGWSIHIERVHATRKAEMEGEQREKDRETMNEIEKVRVEAARKLRNAQGPRTDRKPTKRKDLNRQHSDVESADEPSGEPMLAQMVVTGDRSRVGEEGRGGGY